MKFEIKAGRFVFDKQTKKVKAEKTKGLIRVLYNAAEQQTHFSWINTEASIEELDLIVFGNDAIFEAVSGRPNTFVLRFQMDEERYFFWIQDKMEHAKVVEEINKVINYQPEDEMVDESVPEKPVNEGIQQKNKPSGQIADFIKNMQKNLEQAKKKTEEAQKTAITHLYEVIGTDLNKIANQLTEEEKLSLLQFMPEEQRETKFIGQNIRSPQFLQALDALSDALNSENAISLFMELGLDQKYLYSYYGVEAFVRALVEWGKKQKEQEEKKE